MNIEDIELKLLAGMPVEIENCGLIYSPTVKEVTRIGESQYNKFLSLLLFDKDNLTEKVNDDITDFEIVFLYCYQNEEFRDEFLSALKFIFKKQARLCDVNTSEDVFFVFDDNCKLNNDNFAYMQEIVRVGNHVKIAKKEDEYNPADEITAKVIAEMLERRKKKPKPKPIMNLHSIISGLAWKSGTPSIESILNLTMYQLYDGFKRIEKLDSIHYTLFGIYTGNVDSKKLNTNDLVFTKILD